MHKLQAAQTEGAIPPLKGNAVVEIIRLNFSLHLLYSVTGKALDAVIAPKQTEVLG